MTFSSNLHFWSLALVVGAASACASDGLGCGDGVADLDLDDPAFVYDSGALPVYSIDVADDVVATLPQTGSENTAEDVHATFGFDGPDGDERYDVGLRLRGHDSFRTFDAKPGFKLDLHQWDAEQRFHGIEHLTLANMVQDASVLAEHVGYALYEQLGAPHPLHGYACLVVNGTDYGLYGVVETMDDAFLSRAFADDEGNLYEGGFGADLRDGGTSTFVAQELNDVEDRSDIEGLALAMEETTPDTLLDALAAHFDLDSLLDTWAVEAVSGNIDGYLARGNNFLLYHEPSVDRWWFLPWGIDQAFVGDLDVHDPEYVGDDHESQGVLYAKCVESDACRAELDAHVEGVLGEVEAMDLAGFADDEAHRLRIPARQDPKSEAGPMQTAAAQSALRRWVKARPAVVEDQLE